MGRTVKIPGNPNLLNEILIISFGEKTGEVPIFNMIHSYLKKSVNLTIIGSQIMSIKYFK
jgi:hypothetical protein